MLERPVAEYPGLGWTSKFDQRFADKTPDQVLMSIVRHSGLLLHNGRHGMSALNEYEKDIRQYMDNMLDEISHDGGIFLQFGAHDGNFDDPFSELIPRFDHAVLVEPQVDEFIKLSERRSGSENITLLNVAVAKTPGEITLHKALVPHSPEFGTAIAALDSDQVRSEVRRCLGYFAFLRTKIIQEVVPAVTVSEIVESELNGQSPNVLASDTEGSDHLVVKGVVGELGMRPTVIHYEHLHLCPDKAEEVSKELSTLGYDLTSTHKDTLAVLQ